MPKATKEKQNNAYGSPVRKRAFNDVTNTPTKEKGKGKEKQLNSRPKRAAKRQSKKLDFRNEDDFFDEPAVISPAVHIHTEVSPFTASPLEFQTLDSQNFNSNVYIDQDSDDDEKVSSLNLMSVSLYFKALSSSIRRRQQTI